MTLSFSMPRNVIRVFRFVLFFFDSREPPSTGSRHTPTRPFARPWRDDNVYNIDISATCTERNNLRVKDERSHAEKAPLDTFERGAWALARRSAGHTRALRSHDALIVHLKSRRFMRRLRRPRPTVFRRVYECACLGVNTLAQRRRTFCVFPRTTRVNDSFRAGRRTRKCEIILLHSFFLSFIDCYRRFTDRIYTRIKI